MIKKWLFILSLLLASKSYEQECPSISFPLDGSLEIPVDATITWPAVGGINGYLISFGTSPGAEDIIDRRSIGPNNFFKPPLGLPEDTQIYINLTLIPFDQPPITCEASTFRTIDITAPPPCTVLIAPDNHATNVTIVTEINWLYAPTATYYRLSIGTEPGGVDILNNSNVGNVLSFDPPEDLPNDAQIYVSIIPYNENGSMGKCTEESFSTGPPAYSCDPFIDPLSGQTISQIPLIEFPNTIGICSDELPYLIETKDMAEGFRWYRTNGGSEEMLLSESRSVPISEPGRYRYEAYNTRMEDGRSLECSSTKLFTVVASGTAVIEKINAVRIGNNREITVYVRGLGSYEFALDNISGPYQDSPVFNNVNSAQHTVYVRDKNGCGIAERSVDRDVSLGDFPNFFTPNGDGVNDFWQFMIPPENFEMSIETISIFDRYGSFLALIDPSSQGWDGYFGGRPLPASDYWFKAVTYDKIEIKGHFALKR